MAMTKEIHLYAYASGKFKYYSEAVIYNHDANKEHTLASYQDGRHRKPVERVVSVIPGEIYNHMLWLRVKDHNFARMLFKQHYVTKLINAKARITELENDIENLTKVEIGE